jgi:hypothetical protein
VSGESTSGYGVHGKATTGTGVYAEATDSGGTGIYAKATALGTAAHFEGNVEHDGGIMVHGWLTVEGPAQGFFPRPAYDSGWKSIDQGEILTLYHNLGGSIDDYVVDVRCWDAPGTTGVNNTGVGWVWNDAGFLGIGQGYWGVRWKNLTDASIKVHRGDDDGGCEFAQVRIWVYN